MLHPALQAFYDANAERWADLTIEMRHEDGGYLRLFWRTSESFGYNLTAYVERGDAEICFESSTGTVSQRADALTGAAEACAESLDEEGDHDDDDIEPGTFGAVVWTARHRLRCAEIEEERDTLLASIARMNPA